jgi:hypothetical protein
LKLERIFFEENTLVFNEGKLTRLTMVQSNNIFPSVDARAANEVPVLEPLFVYAPKKISAHS